MRDFTRSIPIGWGLSSLFCFVYYQKRLWAGKVIVQTEGAETAPGGSDE